MTLSAIKHRVIVETVSYLHSVAFFRPQRLARKAARSHATILATLRTCVLMDTL